MAALCISTLSSVDLLPGGKIDVRRVPLLGTHNAETLSEFPGLDELTSARVLGRDGPRMGSEAGSGGAGPRRGDRHGGVAHGEAALRKVA